eukprot:gene11508-24053_t
MLKLLLNRKGLLVDMAEDGLENGIQATISIRSSGFRKLIAGLTGCTLEDDIQKYLKAGADIVLSKPLRIEELDMVLSHVQRNGPFSKNSMKLMESQ